MSATKKRPVDKRETIVEYEYRLSQEAKEISKNHVDVTPVKYLLK